MAPDDCLTLVLMQLPDFLSSKLKGIHMLAGWLLKINSFGKRVVILRPYDPFSCCNVFSYIGAGVVYACTYLYSLAFMHYA